MSNTTVVPSTAGPGPSGGPGGGGGGGGGGTEVIQVTNVSPSASSEQMRTLFGFLGKIDELRLFPPDDSPLPVSSRVCFVKFHDPDSAVVAQHLTNTVFVDRALIVVPYAEVKQPTRVVVHKTAFEKLRAHPWRTDCACLRLVHDLKIEYRSYS